MTRYPTADEVKWYHRELVALQNKEPLLIAGARMSSTVRWRGHRPRSAGRTCCRPWLRRRQRFSSRSRSRIRSWTGTSARPSVPPFGSLELNGITARADNDALYELVIAVTTGAMRDNPEIAARLRELFAGLD